MEPGQQVGTGGHHGGRVQEGRRGGRSRHGREQPWGEGPLGRLGHRGQQHAPDHHGPQPPVGSAQGGQVERAGGGETGAGGEEEAQVPGPGGDEGLGGLRRGVTPPPVGDQSPGQDTDQLPRHQQGEQVLGQQQQLHDPDEGHQQAHHPGPPPVRAVPEGAGRDRQAHEGHQHHRGTSQLIDPDPQGDPAPPPQSSRRGLDHHAHGHGQGGAQGPDGGDGEGRAPRRGDGPDGQAGHDRQGDEAQQQHVILGATRSPRSHRRPGPGTRRRPGRSRSPSPPP